MKNGGGANDDEVDEDKGLGDEEEDSDLLESDPKLWKVSWVLNFAERWAGACEDARS